MEGFNLNNFSVVASAGTWISARYITRDSAEEVCRPGYFDRLYPGIARVGDWISVQADALGRGEHMLLVVVAREGGRLITRRMCGAIGPRFLPQEDRQLWPAAAE